MILIGGCDVFKQADPPAPYVKPVPGTIYHYEGFANQILSSEGLMTIFTDSLGNQGRRIGHFITDDPRNPSELDTARLARFWPLRKGNTLTLNLHSNKQDWQWSFKVMDITDIDVPEGLYRAYVVQAVQKAKDSTVAANGGTVGYTFWYAPEVKAIVRFQTHVGTGPNRGKVIGARLNRITRPPRNWSATPRQVPDSLRGKPRS